MTKGQPLKPGERSPGTTITIRRTPIISEQLNELMQLWGENQSATITRSLQIAYDLYVTMKKDKES